MKIYRDPKTFLSGFYYEEPMEGLPLLTHCGEVLCVPGHRLESHRHRVFEFLYLARGTITWSVHDRTYSQQEGELMAFHPNEWHRTARPAREETHQLWIGLDLAELGADGQRLARLLRRQKVRSLPECHALEPILRAIARQIMKPMPRQKEVVLSYLRVLLQLIEQALRLQKEPPGRAAVPYSYGVLKAITYMEGHLDRRIPVKELAAVATVRRSSHFCGKFKKEVGLTPAAHHLRLRLAAARNGLLQPELSITEIALQFGFNSSQHFSTAFRKTYDVTPRHWRARQ